MYRHVLVLVLVDKEQVPEQDSLGIEGGIDRSVGTDVGCLRGGKLLLFPERFQYHLL